LTRKLLDSLPGKNLYQIGETYGSLSLISLYVKPGMLDGQFDFNVYDTYIWATTRPEGSFEGLAGCIEANLAVYGYHNLMGYISGNHDRPRYISLASGDVKHDEDQKLAGWKRDIVVSDTMAYRKLAMLHALNFTLPGVPCIYYGDEYGQPGANDPDNRRWMEFEGYSSHEQQVADEVKELTHLRRSSMPLMYGDYFQLQAENDIFAYMRSYMGEAVITFLNKSAESREISVTLPFGLAYNGSSAVNVTLEPYSYLIIETNK
jgi:glycosidase